MRVPRESWGQSRLTGSGVARGNERGWVLGDERFKKQIAEMAGRRVAPLPKGPAASECRGQTATQFTLTPIHPWTGAARVHQRIEIRGAPP